ncbi:MAG: twin arginine-targeting protein translocase TatB [Gallionellales bacterium RIFCSPLOWO2_02_FULL_57_47]|nr:MAG: twin arginine-targeting protein translocase TatB [Gallionellales bacterium RIFCSPLOWO2_02_FULL_57_47]OGT15584.1 MAG: twin arginine-targeting protein translocase TatB [Gallionellales bacterium RIFCSPHIGHO2_02_FULL_57_16]
MFDFSFPELMVIMVVALIVIGPERLPKVARTLGHLWGRAQRYVNTVKSDIARDMNIEEIRNLQQAVQAEASAVEQSAKQVITTADQQAQQISAIDAHFPSPEQAMPTPMQSPPESTSAQPKS